MNHVIEHVPSPVETLRTCARLLKPGGKLVAVTPNTAGLCARVYGSSWRELDPPRHLHLFDRNNLRAAAAMAGYAVIDVRTTGANGAGVALGSRYIRDTGRFSMESRSRSTLESAVVRLIQAAEGFVPGLGEECILQAWTAKPAE
jgi:SAM-dependent methyltransferase